MLLLAITYWTGWTAMYFLLSVSPDEVVGLRAAPRQVTTPAPMLLCTLNFSHSSLVWNLNRACCLQVRQAR
jgi:hypothetical protein